MTDNNPFLVGQIVRFHRCACGEDERATRFIVVEPRGERTLIAMLCELPIAPQESVVNGNLLPVADDTLQPLIESAEREFASLGMDGPNAEQIDCLMDATREDEAINMVDDWTDRCGLSDFLRGELVAYITDRHYINARG